jgi:multiple sugar transport system ATP-binding protein
MRAEIKRLHMELRSTTIYVTHDQEEAMTLGDRVVVMKDGVIQQSGPPLEVYQRPSNRFVAGFVGTPPMNFFRGVVTRDAGALWFDEGSGRIAVPAWAKNALANRLGAKVVMGVRPQAMSDEPFVLGSDEGNALTMRIRVVEPLGDKMDVYLATDCHAHVIARVDASRRLLPNTNVKMHFDLDRLHFFDADDAGATIAAAPALS